MRKREVIKFYRIRDEYGYFSNFAPYPIEVDGKIWPTSEHYFQAQKFAGTADEEIVRAAELPMIAAQIGRDRSKRLRPDWEQVKDDIMRRALFAKFTQYPSLRSRLLSTGNAELVEHTANDRYWGMAAMVVARTCLANC